MYLHTSFKGCKNVQNLRKGCVFCHIHKFWKGHDGKIRIKHAKNVYLGSIFIPGKYVLRLCFKTIFTRMISSLKYKWAPGIANSMQEISNLMLHK